MKKQQTAEFRFYGRLQRFSSGEPLVYRFDDRPAIKDPIEALGVPHTEVDLIIVADRSVSFAYRLSAGDQVSVYPAGFPVVLTEPLYLSPATPVPVTFILDVHLGKLARRLRLLGFDCLYRNDYSDARIIQLAGEQERIILTRDRGLLKQARVVHGFLVGSDRVEEQFLEVCRRYQLAGEIRALSRCPLCNGRLRQVEKEQVVQQLPPKTALYYQDFKQCSACRQLYWRGSHFRRLNKWLSELSGQRKG